MPTDLEVAKQAQDAHEKLIGQMLKSSEEKVELRIDSVVAALSVTNGRIDQMEPVMNDMAGNVRKLLDAEIARGAISGEKGRRKMDLRAWMNLALGALVVIIALPAAAQALESLGKAVGP